MINRFLRPDRHVRVLALASAFGLVVLPEIAAAPTANARADEAAQLRLIATMGEHLRARIHTLPVIASARQPLNAVRDTVVLLNHDPVIVDGQRFDAVVVSAPEARAVFAWAFASPSNVSRWYIMPESGEMRGFKDFLRRPRAALPRANEFLPGANDQITLQKLDAANLSPNRRYILWFNFTDDAPVELSLRAGFFSGTVSTNSRLPGLLFPAEAAQ